MSSQPVPQAKSSTFVICIKTILISLRENKKSGDVEDFTIERRVRDAFLQNEEWCQVEIRHRTHRLTLSVIFPAACRCQKAVLSARSRYRTVELGPEHLHDLPDGRQRLTWQARDIAPLEVYTLSWRW